MSLDSIFRGQVSFFFCSMRLVSDFPELLFAALYDHGKRTGCSCERQCRDIQGLWLLWWYQWGIESTKPGSNQPHSSLAFILSENVNSYYLRQLKLGFLLVQKYFKTYHYYTISTVFSFSSTSSVTFANNPFCHSLLDWNLKMLYLFRECFNKQTNKNNLVYIK